MALTNSCRIIGYCANDPVLINSSSGKMMAKVAVYTEHWWINHQTNEQKTYKNYHWCIFFGNNAHRAKKLLMKGSQVHIEGTLNYLSQEYANRKFHLPQIWVDQFMISTKATMTKELYDQIFPEEIVPYQVYFQSHDNLFDVNVMIKLADCRGTLDDQELLHSGFHLSAYKENKSNQEKNQNGIKEVKESNNTVIFEFLMDPENKERSVKNGYFSIYQNHLIRQFTIKDIQFSKTEKALLEEAIISTAVISHQKRFYECQYPFEQIVVQAV